MDFSLQKRRCTNAQYVKNPTMVYSVKMEYVSKTTIFGLKMMVKSGLEKILLKFLHAEVTKDFLCALRELKQRILYSICTF